MFSFIFFGGTGDKPLREYNARELGFDNADQGSIVQLRQRYFHVWFLPFFPLGKFWLLRTGNEWYPLTEEEKKTAEQYAEIPPTPFYTWTGSILLPIVIALFIMVRKMTNQ